MTMPQKTSIEWTEVTWNPVTGCTKISTGCKYCYAERMAIRLHAMGIKRYRNGFDVTLQPDLISQPDKWKTPRTIFVNSMSDLFHENIPLSYIEKVFETIIRNPQHTFQVLTKRSERLVKLSSDLIWPHNLWMGVTVESSDYVFRVNDLRETAAAVKFLSCEPLLSNIDALDLSGIDWLIVGGESGPKCRPMKKEWVTNLKRICEQTNTPFFFKQWGGTRRKKSGRLLNGRTYNEMPHL